MVKLHWAVSSYTRALGALFVGAATLLPACSGPANSAGSNSKHEEVVAAQSALTNMSGGSRILSDFDPSYALNAVGGAYDGGPVQLWQGCEKSNPDCNWILRDGMIVSANDTTLAIRRSGDDLSGLTLNGSCSPDNPDCTWTWSKGMFINTADSYPMNAWLSPHQPNPSPLVLNSACDASNANCTWTIESAHLTSATDPRLAIGTSATPGEQSPVNLLYCPSSNANCTWTFKQGLMHSDANPALNVNALNGAGQGTELHVVSNCDASNTDCTWTLRGGLILSDSNNVGAPFAVTTHGPTADVTQLTLTESSEWGTTWGTPACKFEAAPAAVGWSSGTAPTAQWTVMILIPPPDSDGALYNLAQFAEAGSSDNVNILALLGTHSDYDYANGHLPLYRGHGVYLRINKFADPTVLKDVGIIPGFGSNTTPNSISDFAKFAISHFPAAHYALLDVGEGGGFAGANGLSIPNGDYATALAAITAPQSQGGIGAKLDIVTHDACIMGAWEVAAATAPYANFLVASEQFEYAVAWAYGQFLSALVQQPTMSARSWATLMVDWFTPRCLLQNNSDGSHSTNSALSLTDLGLSLTGTAGLTAAVSSLGAALNSPRFYDCVEAARTQPGAISFTYYYPIPAGHGAQELSDLYDLAGRIGTSCSFDPTVVTAAAAVQQGVTNTVLRMNYDPGPTNLPRGLSIYIPGKCTSAYPYYYYSSTYPGALWAVQTQWDDFCGVLRRGLRP